MQLTDDLRTSLKREYILCSNAVVFYKNTLKQFEKKYHFTTQTFLKHFEAGQIGDEADYFDWFAFAKLLAEWQRTQSALRAAVE